MKNRKVLWIIAAVFIFFALLIGTFLLYRLQASMLNKKSAVAVSIIGGADGPTSIFLAGKVGKDKSMKYKQITMEDAKAIFESDAKEPYVIVDVRREDEFAEGHILGAINIANESITSEEIEELPDKNQTIYVYCRSGNRSKQAALKLVALGYKNVIEFGGITDWTGDIVKN